MTAKELKRLRRADLLELLLEESKENERLRRELEEARAQLDERSIRIEQSGTLAEAALSLSGVFESAQAACDLYMENVRRENQEAAKHSNSIRYLKNLCGPCPILKIVLDRTAQEDA